ncbi:MAG: 4Fe-4S binding protein, partial [Clostridium sp.]|nr:4Fe-4S binding protein [Clostridium sp.]
GKSVIEVQESKCIGCRLCEKICTASAIRVIDKKAVISQTSCLSCGMCAVKCPRKAIVDLRGILMPVKGQM